MLRGYFIQYKFILPENTKHTSYTYQKLFRALYGYTQTVNKSTGKTYKYHRRGILSNHPYIRTGKNCVIIPPNAFQKLTTFFKTGANPTHKWKVKGDWKAVYYMDEKNINSNLATESVEELLDRTYMITQRHLVNEAKQLLEGNKIDEIKKIKPEIVPLMESILADDWFKTTYTSSKKLKEFKDVYDAISKI